MIGIATVVPQFAPQAGTIATSASTTTGANSSHAFSADLLAYSAPAPSDSPNAGDQRSAACKAAKQLGSTSHPVVAAPQILGGSSAVPTKNAGASSAAATSLLSSVKAPTGQASIASIVPQPQTLAEQAARNAAAKADSAAMPGEVPAPIVAPALSNADPQVAKSNAEPTAQSGTLTNSPTQKQTAQPPDVSQDVVPTAAPAPRAEQTAVTPSSVSATGKGEASSLSTESAANKKKPKSAVANVPISQPAIHTLSPGVSVPFAPLAQKPQAADASNAAPSPTRTVSQTGIVSPAKSAAPSGQTFAVSAPQIQPASDSAPLNLNAGAHGTTTDGGNTHSTSSVLEHSFANVLSNSSSNGSTGEASSSPQSAAPASGVTASSVPAAIPGLHLGGAIPAITGLPQPQTGPATDTATSSQPVLSSSSASTAAGSTAHAAAEPYLAQQTTLHATPNSLEVGLSGGSQGWLKVRAEVHGENVSATLSSTSTTGTKLLHEQLPALNAFLNTQNISVATTVAPRLAGSSEQHSTTANLSHEGGQQGSSPQSQSQRQSTPASEPRATNSLLGDMVGHPAALSILQPAMLTGSGSWLNVLA